MKILFVYPDYMHGRYKPIGISILSALLKEQGHIVKVFDSSDYETSRPPADQGVDHLIFKAYKYPAVARHLIQQNVLEGFRDTVKHFAPDIIAVSVTYLLYNHGLKLISALGKRKVPCIFGGVHVTLNPEEVIAHDNVDIICCGEGEEAFLNLIETISRDGDISKIPNIWSKKNGRIVRNAMRPQRETLDDLPFVDWTLYPESHFYKPYMGTVRRAGDLIASRGCANSCSYCFYHSYYRMYGTKNMLVFKSPQRAIEELKHVRDTYGVTLVKMRDADFTAFPEDTLAEMARIYKESEPDMPQILINVNSYTVTRKKVHFLKEMNCLSASIGLETGSDYLKKTYLNRRQDNTEFINAVRYFHDYDIRVCSSNMIGIPHETRNNIFETIELNKKADVDVADVSILFPFPGTQIHTYVKEHGLLRSDLSAADYYRSEPVLDNSEISKGELKALMKTFQLYINAPRLLYSLIQRAESDDNNGRLLLKVLKRIFYVYIFYVRQPYRRLIRLCRYHMRNTFKHYRC